MCIQIGIKQVLENMIYYVNFKQIIAFIVTKFGNIPFKYFKENFIRVL